MLGESYVSSIPPRAELTIQWYVNQSPSQPFGWNSRAEASLSSLQFRSHLLSVYSLEVSDLEVLGLNEALVWGLSAE